MHVLVCDDDPAVRFVVKRWLTTTLGCVVSESGDGVEALEALDHQHIDLLLLDLEMPRLSGVEVVEAIRESGQYADLPIVVLSNERRQPMVKQVMSLGVSDYLLKPLRATVVRDRISPLLARSKRRRRATSVLRQLGPDTTALLVDGDSNFRPVFVTAAERFGPIVTADSGADALAAFRASPAEIVFVGRDLGILGAESMMRKMRDVASVPPCFISVGWGDEAAVKAAGFDGVVERSYQPDVLTRSLQPYVRQVGPLTELHEVAPGFDHCVDSAVPQVLGMMADLAVGSIAGAVVMPEEGRLGVITTQTGRFSIQMALGMTDETATAIAARMLGCEPGDVDEESTTSTLSELANMITGRVDAWLKERGLDCKMGLPETRAISADDMGEPPGGHGFTRGFSLGAVPGIVVVRARVSVPD